MIVRLKLYTCVAEAPSPVPPATSQATGAGGFIRTSGTRFVDAACNDFVVAGVNTWELLETEMSLVNPDFKDKGRLSGTDANAYYFDTVRDAGINLVRSGVSPAAATVTRA